MRVIGLVLALGLTLMPVAAEAQQAGKVWRIGFFGAPGPSAEADAFRQGLRDLGYIEGQNTTIEYRFAGGQVERLPELASELARLKVDVIVASNTPSAMAAKAATSTIPIVFAVVADAVGAGLISNFARPGGNITGLTSISSELSGKRLELLKQVAPNASRLAVLYDPSDRSNVLMLKELQESARVLGLTVHPLEARAPGDFGGAFAAMNRERDSVLFVAAGVLTLEHRNRKALVDLATKSRIPAMWGHRQFVEAGGLMSYAVNFYDQLRRAAQLRGQDPQGGQAGRPARRTADKV